MAVPVSLLLIAFICTHHTTQLLVSSTYCPAAERLALTELKTNTIDPARRLSSWSGTDCCQWDGVHCDNQTGHVIAVDLRNLHFDDFGDADSLWALEFGLLSPSLLNLNHLLHLDLSGNHFKFPVIPQFLGSFKNLRYLNLSHTNISGTIPHHLGNLSTLHTLSLQAYHKYDDGSLALDDPWWIPGLTSLEHFEIGSALLGRGWIQALNMLSSLRQIRVSDSSVDAGDSQSLPLVNFTSLEVLDLPNNWGLTSAILSWLPNLTHLQYLDLSYNYLNGFLPSAIWNLRRLQSLDLSINALTGRLPFSIANMASLEYLSLDENSISGAIPASIGNLTQLLWLDLSSNTLTGTIPQSLWQLSNLIRLDFSNNSLAGVVTESHFDSLAKLQVLSMSHNSMLDLKIISGWQPPFKLSGLGLAGCRVGPQFPGWLRTQWNITSLDLSNASISDSLPDWFWNNQGFFYLNLSHNEIRGRLPRLLQGIEDFATIDLHSNHFHGLLPANVQSIGLLDLSDNRFTGAIPPQMANIASYYLSLSRNYLTGTVPSSFCQGSGLSLLDLSDNQLTGQLPNCTLSQDLKILDVSNNNLSGDIPHAFLNSTIFQSLFLNGNSFTGEVPTILMQSKEMYVLDLGNNRFTGNVPIWLDESFTNLRILRLCSNMLTGSLPTETLSRVPNLQILDLSHNNLSGVIPKSFGNLTAMMRHNDQGYGISQFISSSIYGFGIYTDKVLLDIKGRDSEYAELLRFLQLLTSQIITCQVLFLKNWETSLGCKV